MVDEVIIFDEVGPAGLRKLLVMRVGEAVDPLPWLLQVPEEMRTRVELIEFTLGDRVKQHYLKLEWPTREVVRLTVRDLRACIGDGYRAQDFVTAGADWLAAVMWTLEEGERISGGIRSAAELYRGTFGRWPRRAILWKGAQFPREKGARGEGTLEMGEGRVSIHAAGWVPKGCVVVV